MTHPNGTSGREDRASLGQLVGSMTQSLSSLVRDEIALAKAEVAESAKRGATGAALLAVTATLLLMVWLLLTWAAVYGLSAGTGLQLWASFLIIAGIYLVIAIILAFIASRHLKKVRGPEQAQRAADETKQILSGLKPTPASASDASGPAATAPSPATEASEAVSDATASTGTTTAVPPTPSAGT